MRCVRPVEFRPTRAKPGFQVGRRGIHAEFEQHVPVDGAERFSRRDQRVSGVEEHDRGIAATAWRRSYQWV
jgi:hypothetical protein